MDKVELGGSGDVGRVSRIGWTMNVGEESFIGQRVRNSSSFLDEVKELMKRDRLKRSRAGDLSWLTRLHNDISELITAEDITLKSVLVVIEHEQTIYDLRVSEHYDIMYDVDEWIKKTRLTEVKADDWISQVGLSTRSQRSYQRSAVRRVGPICYTNPERYASREASTNPRSTHEYTNSRSHEVLANPASHVSRGSHASHGSHASRGSHTSWGSHASSIIKFNEAKEKRELASLKLQQLERLKEIEFKRLAMKSEEDTLKL